MSALVTNAPLTPLPWDFDAVPTTLQGTEGQPAARPAAPPTGKEAGAPGTGSGGGAGGIGSFLPFIAIGAIFWFLIIGPERKNRKKRDEMLKAIKKGDKVMTTGGMYGRIVELRDDTVTLDAGDVKLKFSRAAIQGVVDGDGD